MSLTERGKWLSARERDEVFERRSIFPGAATVSRARAVCAGTAFAAPIGALEPDREDEVLGPRRGMGVVSSVASRSMSTFTLSERCGRGAGADAAARAGIDAAGRVGAGSGAAARGAVPESEHTYW